MTKRWGIVVKHNFPQIGGARPRVFKRHKKYRDCTTDKYLYKITKRSSNTLYEFYKLVTFLAPVSCGNLNFSLLIPKIALL